MRIEKPGPVHHAWWIFCGCLPDSRCLLHWVDNAKGRQQKNGSLADRTRHDYGRNAGGRLRGIYRAFRGAHDSVGQPASTARLGAAFFAAFFGVAFLCFALLAIAFSTAPSTTFAVMPLWTAFLT